jgi:hypothetical protein
VTLIECYDEWLSGFSSLFNPKKSPVPSLCYFGEWCGDPPYFEPATTACMLGGYLFTVITYKFEITATILITNILPI